MRLGGFVIHGNSVGTLPECLESLFAVCDEVVAVDSESTDGSAAVARRLGARTVVAPWRGYGAARSIAVQHLPDCDWLLYLDSDERLDSAARTALRAWKTTNSPATSHLLRVNDWAELSSGRFLYRSHHRARLVRREVATWRPDMIVHEALDQPNAVRLPIEIQHRFASDVSVRARKESFYALLWAVRAQAEGRRGKVAFVQRPALFLRDAFFKGAAWRGGLMGARLAWQVAAYHELKYRFLADLRRGGFPELTQAFAAGDFQRVFELARRSTERAT